VLAGALFPPALATLLMTILTTLGALLSTLLAKPLSPIITHFFPRVLDMTRHALEGDTDSAILGKSPKTSPWVRLSVLRLIGVVPWSGINIACGVCGVALWDCVFSTFIGSLPWTAVTCQIGDILQTVASTPSPTPQSITSLLGTPEIILKLVFLSILSLAPILGRDQLKAFINQSKERRHRHPKWAWAKALSARVRMPQQAKSSKGGAKEDEQELVILIQEKEALS